MAKKEQKIDLTETWSSSRITVFLQTTASTVVITAALAGSGYLLDQLLGTWPGLFITGLILAFPLTQLYLYKKFKKFAQTKVSEAKKKK